MASTVHHQDEQITLHLGDCLDVLPTLPGNSVDAVVCDPPYSLPGGFMGKEWDRHDSPRAFQAWCEAWARECLRVLKPGGHLLAFGAPRTYHRLAAGIEDAGFEIRDSIHWVYGQGFPKGQDIAKAIDRRRDDRADVLQVTAWLREARDAAGWTSARVDALFGFNGMGSHWCAVTGKAAIVPTLEQWAVLRGAIGFDDAGILPLVEQLNRRKGEIGEAFGQREILGTAHRVRRASDVQIAGLSDGAYDVTAPALDEAKHWEGWNTALKPAHEPIIVARKSTGFNTTVANVLEHGTGALNIDGCRVLTGQSPSIERRHGKPPEREAGSWANDRRSAEAYAAEHPGESLGRWPANLVLTHSPACEQIGERVIPGDSRVGREPGTRPGGFGDVRADRGDERPNGALHGDETVAVFACAPGCPVAELDRQSGVLTSGANPARRGSDKFRDAYGDFAGQRECTPVRGADSGGASRFFPVFRYEAKAPASQRPRLADGTAHATVKPLELMRWLVRLVTPPGGTVLDPFAGSGTTGEAAIIEGFNALLIERERPYADLIVARLSKPLQPTLFGEAA